MIKKAIVLTAVVGGFSFFSGGVDLAEAACDFTPGTGTGNFILNCETDTMGSPVFSFNPTSLKNAVENTTAGPGNPCFTCPNGGVADGSTAGALTNNMFGVIRDNDDPDLGKQSFRADDNNPDIPDTGSNDSGDFTFTFAIPSQNFLSQGTSVPSTIPSAGEPVGKAGVKMEFPTNTFSFVAGGGSSFNQRIDQTTFVGGLGGNEIQIVSFQADSASSIPDLSTGQGNSQDVNWEQSIEEGGFNLGVTNGTFEYGEKGVGPADAPTGASQSAGDDNAAIGGF